MYTDDVERPAVPRLSRQRSQSAGDRQRLRQHDQSCARPRQRHGQPALRRASARMDRNARPALLGGGSRRLLLRRRRYGGPYRAPIQRPRRRDAECQRRDGREPRRTLAMDRRGALSQARRRDLARFRRRREREPARPCRAARSDARRLRAGADRSDRAEGRRCGRFAPCARRCVAAERGRAGGPRRGGRSCRRRERLAEIVARPRQDRDRRQAHGLCLHRPAMLARR